MTPEQRAQAAHWAWASALVLCFGAVCAGWDVPLTDGKDGGYYFQIARHVSEGDGLLTSVSLYHQGLEPLPQRSTVYPAWPWLLGQVGSVIGIERAARAVPTALFCV